MNLLAHTSVVLLATTACSGVPSPAARDSVAAPTPKPAATSAAPPAAPGQPAPLPARADSTRPARTAVQQSYTRILSQQSTGFDEPTELVIGDRRALESAWTLLFNHVQGNPPPAVDFTRETVILVALGAHRSGGYAVHVDAVTRSGDDAVVRYTATSPGPACMSTQALTAPADVVRAPRIAGQVRFERHDAVMAC